MRWMVVLVEERWIDRGNNKIYNRRKFDKIKERF